MNVYYEDFFNWNSYETFKICNLENQSSKFRVQGEIVNIMRIDSKHRNLQYQLKVMDETGVLKIKYNVKSSSPCYKTLRHLKLGNVVQVYSNIVTGRSSLNEWRLALCAEDAESKIEIISEDSLKRDFLFLDLSNLSPLRLLKDMQTATAVHALVALQWKHDVENYQCGAGIKRVKRLIEVTDGFYSAILILHDEPLVFASEEWNAQTVLYITHMNVYADAHGLPELNIEDAEVQVRCLNHNKIGEFSRIVHDQLKLLIHDSSKRWTLKALEEQTVSSGLQVIGVVNVLIVKSKIRKLLNSKNLFIQADSGALKFNNFVETIIDESGCLQHPKFHSTLLEFLLGYSPEEVNGMNESEICQLEEIFLYRRFNLVARAYGNIIEFFESKSLQTEYDDDGQFINWTI
ncbi:Schizosaccharomyces specific protein Meu32 [Schizosaccharomyces osmophilus]|uniref:Schizosaccharomyces specific protein Meu32 n=1 Tax=Schizosaccharomyces osmophilus TaxID=2545709 RepID=A0AAE9W771_9SCHI|nr:Schizosaccharomyces specific protein Meu32 [Schizosaccharomyces osmophilus]WBW71197.1 Schizosaccharomyces specific protein Meu32 [Schizosaccharomyces osmophilus]